jgi:hypothetical protein
MIAHLFFLAWYRVIILQLLPFDEVNAAKTATFVAD